MGMETPTNFPFWRAGPVLGTKLPRRMPITMARKIQRARKRSRRPREEKAETLAREAGMDCFSTSGFSTRGEGLGWADTGCESMTSCPRPGSASSSPVGNIVNRRPIFFLATFLSKALGLRSGLLLLRGRQGARTNIFSLICVV